MLRDELVSRLRNPSHRDPQTIDELREYALHCCDHRIQMAAISGLVKFGGSEAVVVLAQRALDDLGLDMGVIERAIKRLATLAPDGGLLALTATFPKDIRFIHQKLEILAVAAKKMDRDDVSESIALIYRQNRTIYEMKEWVPRYLVLLENCALDDIRQGATLARILRPFPMWAVTVPPPDRTSLDTAIAYSEQRVPGLVEVLREHRNQDV